MKFLIAGFGSIGRRHMRNLLALGERDILFYRSRHSTLPTDELQGFTVETDLRDALAHQPDAVIIANPTALHLEVAIPAAEAGCHLLIEKPVSHSLRRLPDLQTALARGGGKALVAFQFRYHPSLQKAAALLAAGEIGRPISARAHWGEYLPDWHPWEDYRNSYAARPELGGGVVLTLSHPLDYLRWLLGEVESLYAMSGKLSDLELSVEDTAEISLRFASGALGSLHLDYVQRPPAHRLEIIGAEGSLRWDNADGTLRVYRAGAEGWKTFPPPEDFERNDLFLAELRHFIRVARGEEAPRCTLEDGIQVLKMALAVHESAQTRREVRL
jgi:predicted dehydrogenase